MTFSGVRNERIAETADEKKKRNKGGKKKCTGPHQWKTRWIYAPKTAFVAFLHV